MTHCIKAAKSSVMDLTGEGEEWLFDAQDELIARFWNGSLITSTLSLSSVGGSAKDQADLPTLVLKEEHGQREQQGAQYA